MGVDLVVEGCAKLGYEKEWRRLLERFFADEGLSEAESKHFQQISVPGHQRIGAPQVGQDGVANQRIVEERNAKTPEEVAAVSGFTTVGNVQLRSESGAHSASPRRRASRCFYGNTTGCQDREQNRHENECRNVS